MLLFGLDLEVCDRLLTSKAQRRLPIKFKTGIIKAAKAPETAGVNHCLASIAVRINVLRQKAEKEIITKR